MDEEFSTLPSVRTDQRIVHIPEHSYPAAAVIRQENQDFLSRQEALREILVNGVDYGNPGGRWPKPSMYQTGANKIIARLRLWHRAEIIDSWRDTGGNEYGATILVTLMAGHQPVATGLGYADSFEKRRQDGRGSAWNGNTCYQMAHKRAKVSAARLISGLDAEFTQDVEDGGMVPPRADRRTGEIKQPKPPTTAPKEPWYVGVATQAQALYGYDETFCLEIVGAETWEEASQSTPPSGVWAQIVAFAESQSADPQTAFDETFPQQSEPGLYP